MGISHNTPKYLIFLFYKIFPAFGRRCRQRTIPDASGTAAADTRNAECCLCGRCLAVGPIEGALVLADPPAGGKKP